MSQKDLTLVIKARDEASKALAGLGGNVLNINKTMALAGAAMTSTAGVMADLAREGAADAAAFKAVQMAVGNASEQLDETTTKLANNRDALAGTEAFLQSSQAEYTKLQSVLASAQSGVAAMTGASKEDKAARQALNQVISESKSRMAELEKSMHTQGTAAMELKNAISLQSGQVKAMGISTGDAEAAISTYINKMRDQAAIADDNLKPALAGLIATTGDYQKSMELASLAADLARGKNMDLQTAALLVGKVAMGNTSVLTRYGIVLGENATAEEALAELQKRFAGQAEAYGQTTKGQLEILHLKLGDFREDIGSAINEVAPFIGLLPGLSAAYSGLGGAVGLVTKTYGINTIAGIAHKAATAAGAVAMGIMTGAQWALNVAMTANPIGLLVVALAGLVAGVVWAYQNVDWFRALVDNAFSWIRDNAIPILVAMAGPLGAIAAGFKWAYDNIGPFKDIVDRTVDTVKNMLGPLRDLLDLIGRIPSSISLPSIPKFELPSIPGFAAGGLVPGPIGAPMLAMVHGGETVTPPGRGGGISVYVTVQGSILAERDLAETIRRELLLLKGRNVNTGL